MGMMMMCIMAGWIKRKYGYGWNDKLMMGQERDKWSQQEIREDNKSIWCGVVVDGWWLRVSVYPVCWVLNVCTEICNVVVMIFGTDTTAIVIAFVWAFYWNKILKWQ